jgi:hypothetical protein
MACLDCFRTQPNCHKRWKHSLWRFGQSQCGEAIVQRIVLALVMASSWFVTAANLSPAEASCAVVQPLRKVVPTAPVVFVGTVRSVSDFGGVATVRVNDIWRGRSVPRQVTVDGTANGHLGTESRYFRAHRRYLFVPNPTRYKWLYYESICTPTRQYRSQMERFRPAKAHHP